MNQQPSTRHISMSDMGYKGKQRVYALMLTELKDFATKGAVQSMHTINEEQLEELGVIAENWLLHGTKPTASKE